MPPDRSSSPREVTPAAFSRFTLAALAAQVLIVMSGAAVRLTGSGLGCSDWPRCEQDRFVASLDFHPMVEFANRLVSFVVVATVALVIWGAVRRLPYRRDLLDLGIVLAVVTGVQVVLGGITVMAELWPPVVMGHFLLSMLLLWFATVLHHRASRDLQPPPPPLRSPVSSRLATPLVVLGTAVLVTGSVVTGSGPHGGDEEVERLGFYVPTVTRVHAVTVIAFLALLVVVLLVLRKRPGSAMPMRAGSVVLATTLVQGSIGYYQYFNGVPALAVFLHVVGAMAVWITAVWFVLEHRRAEHQTTPGSPSQGSGVPAPLARPGP